MPPREARVRSVTLPNGAATPTAGLRLGMDTLLAVRSPSTYDGTTMTFTVCDTLAGTYDTVYNEDGTAYTITLAASRFTPVDYTKFLGALYLKPVAGTNQTGDTILSLLVSPL